MNELWRVQGATGAVRMMSLDDIDRAFNAGYLNAGTNVLAPGSMRWQTLGEAAGLDEAASEQTPSLSPMAIANAPASYQLPHIPQYQALDIEDEDIAPKKSRKGVFFGVLVAAAAAASVFGVQTGRINIAKLTSASRVESVAAIAPPPVEMKLPAPATAEQPKAEAKPVLTDEMKRQLLDADKAKAKKNAKGKRRYVRAQADGDDEQQVVRTPEAKPLVEGGDKFDPLNGSL